jgi:hypothetical protein
VYECAACGTRALGDQRCADCATFMRKIGIGANCPSCFEPVAVTDLLDEHTALSVQPAARPATRRPRNAGTAPTATAKGGRP